MSLTLIKEIVGTIVGWALIISLGWFIWWSKTSQSLEQAQASYDQYIDGSP